MTVKPNINASIYTNTLVELRARIETKAGSLRAFCIEHKIDQANLYKCFNGTAGQEMSIGLFARVCKALGNPVAGEITNSNLSLKQYLDIDNNAVFKCIMLINFGGAQI